MAKKRESSTKTAVTAEQTIRAIRGSGGVKTTIAKRLNVTRQTVDNYLARWVTVREAYIEEKAGIDDAALSVVMQDIVTHKNVQTAKWWIERKLDEFNPKLKIEGWHDEVIEKLSNGTLTPEQARAMYADVPDLLSEFFRKAGIDAG